MAGLIIFVKNPELGKVKTRLAATVGDERALIIYRELMRHTREIALALNVNRYLFYSEWIPEKDDWSKDQFNKALQPKGDLGDRMAFAFQRVLAKEPKAVIIGSDCASLKPEIVKTAFDQLEKYDCTLGPALDGGYYLLGMREFQADLFQNMSWSTATVAGETLRRMKSKRKTCFLLPTLSDIDYEEDWKQYGWEI